MPSLSQQSCAGRSGGAVTIPAKLCRVVQWCRHYPSRVVLGGPVVSPLSQQSCAGWSSGAIVQSHMSAMMSELKSVDLSVVYSWMAKLLGISPDHLGMSTYATYFLCQGIPRRSSYYAWTIHGYSYRWGMEYIVLTGY